MNAAELQRMSADLVARHSIPKSTVSHPAGVIVPGDAFMTDKLRDPDYVPYCLIRSECGRTRRTEFGFQCPTCGNQMNYDLTHYDGNANVQYEGVAPVPTTAQWNAIVDARKAARAARRAAA